jgi:hypothetical protein
MRRKLLPFIALTCAIGTIGGCKRHGAIEPAEAAADGSARASTFMPRNADSTTRGSGGMFTGGSNTEPRLDNRWMFTEVYGDRMVPNEPDAPSEPPEPPFPPPRPPTGFPGPTSETGPIHPLP